MTSPEPVAVDPATIALLAELQVRRKFYISTVNKQTNALGALARRALGWRYDMPETERAKIAVRAQRIVRAGLAGQEPAADDLAVAGALRGELAVMAAALAPLEAARHEIEMTMKRTARRLSVYPWAAAVRGFGDLALAIVVGEAGDLAAYPKKGHLWKRFGLAPHEGHAYSTWRREGGLTAEEWTAAGYAPKRRAEIYAVVAEPMIKHQIVGAEKSGTRYGAPAGPYGELYVARRIALESLHPDWTPKHSQLDALRLMSKRLLRDLWQAWNGRRAAPLVSPDEETRQPLPSAHPVEREAEIVLPFDEASSFLPPAHAIPAGEVAA